MKILALDTALGACSVAVLSDGEVLAHRRETMDRGHAEALAPMVEKSMRESGIAFAELDRLGVTVGPGTFTGQRVGLSFMRALRVALKCPLVGITSLAAMAAEAMKEADAGVAAALHDARNGHVYLELFDRTGSRAAPSLRAQDEAADMIAQFARTEPIVLCGTAAPRIGAQLRARKVATMASAITAPDAVWVGRLAMREAVPARPPRPLYLEEPAAKVAAARAP